MESKYSRVLNNPTSSPDGSDGSDRSDGSEGIIKQYIENKTSNVFQLLSYEGRFDEVWAPKFIYHQQR